LPATFFCSIRSRYDQGHASRPPSARMDAPRARGEMRPSLEGTSPPPWNELSLWHAIEMQPSVPSCIAPTLICHSVPWPRQPHTVTHKKKGCAPPRATVGTLRTAANPRRRTPCPLRRGLRCRWAPTPEFRSLSPFTMLSFVLSGTLWPFLGNLHQPIRTGVPTHLNRTPHD